MMENVQHAFVVGGSRGIGAAVARRLARDGARVTITYTRAADAAAAVAEEIGGSCVKVDAEDRSGLVAAISNAGPIDILVYNAGAFEVGDPIGMDLDAVDRMIDVNVRGAFHAVVAAVRTMPDGGRVVLTGSSAAERVPTPGVAAYAMTKAALQGLARGLARDLGDRNITVNVVQPGPTDTDMSPADGPFAKQLHQFMAIKRHSTPDEIAGAVAYLVGPDAGGMTGSMLTIDGGFRA